MWCNECALSLVGVYEYDYVLFGCDGCAFVRSKFMNVHWLVHSKSCLVCDESPLLSCIVVSLYWCVMH